MGITRKVLSLGTMGLVDFQSDKERVARSTRLTKQATRKQNRLIAEQTNALKQQHEEMVALQRQALEQQSRTHQPVLAPGWYPDTHQTGFVRWWDGSSWTQNVRPA